MNFSPDIATVREIAAGGSYRILPVSCELSAELCTTIEALRILIREDQK